MTRANGEVVAVVRRDHLCAALDARLGLVDVCGLEATTPTARPSRRSSAGCPRTATGAAPPIPVLPNQPTLFYRAGLENICEAVAELVIDAPAESGHAERKLVERRARRRHRRLRRDHHGAHALGRARRARRRAS